MSFHVDRPALLLGALLLATAATGCGRLEWHNDAPEIRSVSFTLERYDRLTWVVDADVYDDDALEFLTVDVEVRDARGAWVGGPTIIDLTGGGGNSYHFQAAVDQVPDLDPTQPYDLTLTVTDLTGERDTATAHYTPADLNAPEIADGGWFCQDVDQEAVFVAWAQIEDDDGVADVADAGVTFYEPTGGAALATLPLDYDIDAGTFQYEDFAAYLPLGIGCDAALDAVFWAWDSVGLYAELDVSGGTP